MKRIALFVVVIMTASFLVSSVKKYILIFFPDGNSITAELALTDQERMQGLMFRTGLSEDQGMLFVFAEERIYPFWMKNMKFAIDIIWLDSQKRIVHIERSVPPCKKEPCPSYSPDLSALYVLELRAGSVDERKLKLHDQLEFILSNCQDNEYKKNDSFHWFCSPMRFANSSAAF
jgi:uncharacterized membrane protein (UPF0127 family)